MTSEPEKHVKTAIVGNLKLPPLGEQDEGAGAPDPREKVPMLIELNARYPRGLAAVSAALSTLRYRYREQAGSSWSAATRYGSPVLPTVPQQFAVVASSLYQCVLSRATVQGDSPVHSVTLLQGAFSHWSFADDTGNPFDVAEDGSRPAHRGRGRRAQLNNRGLGSFNRL